MGLLIAGLLSTAAFAQNQFDNSADATLAGNYFVRELLVTNVSAKGAIGRARSAIGTVSFNTQGGYTFNGQAMDSSVQSLVASPLTVSNGTFAVAANGMLQMQSLLATASGNPDILRGGVGIAGPAAFVASTTEGPNYDMIVGIPLATGLSDASLQGLYKFTYLDFFGGQASQVRNVWFTLNALGNGVAGFATQPTGSAANISNTQFTQFGPNAAYTLSDASGGSLNFQDSPDPTLLIGGAKMFYISPDGLIVLGGDPNDYDLLIGTQPVSGFAASNAGAYSFYYVAGLEENATQITPQGTGTDVIDDYYGSSSTTPAGLAIDHLRVKALDEAPVDETFNVSYTVTSTGAFDPGGGPYRYVVGSRDLVFVGNGLDGQYSMIVGLAQGYSRNSNVYINPLGIVNAASYAPITNPIAPLEVVLLFGQGFSQTTKTATPLLPTTLAGTQVFINGVAAPLYMVSPTLIEVQVPLHIGPDWGVSYATFQVVSNQIPSNPVTVYVRGTAPGIFTAGADGIGGAAVLHADGSLVDSANPATSNETVELFTTGLGTVTPGVGDGAGGLAPPHASIADGKPMVYIGGIASPSIPYAGLAPGWAGLYQVNFVVPPGAPSGDLNLSILTADGISAQTTISVQATAR